MTEHERPLLADLQDQLGAVATDLGAMLALRWDLARSELRAGTRSVKRLALAATVSGVMAMVALPLLLTSLCESLDGRLGIARGGWLWIFALTLLAGAATVALLAWRRFRRHFTGLAETLEECREDVVWLREWLDRDA
jgi:hypothetical protein